MTKDNLNEMARSRQQQGLKHYQKAIVAALVTVAIAVFFVIANLSNVAILVVLVGCGVAIKFALQGNRAIARYADVETGIAAIMISRIDKRKSHIFGSTSRRCPVE